jgi:hypothetical protein
VLAFSPLEELSGIPIKPSRFFAMVIAGGLSLDVVGGLSHFRVADSTLPQRVWAMIWLAWAFYKGLNIYFILGSLFRLDYGAKLGSTWLYLAFYVVYCAPTVGGFVIVGQMLKAYEICYRTN